MSASDAVPLPRLGEVFFDVRGDARSMRLSWYAETGVAVFSIWQGDRCTGTFRLPIADLPRMVETLQAGPPAAGGGPDSYATGWYQQPAAGPQLPPEARQPLPEARPEARRMPPGAQRLPPGAQRLPPGAEPLAAVGPGRAAPAAGGRPGRPAAQWPDAGRANPPETDWRGPADTDRRRAPDTDRHSAAYADRHSTAYPDRRSMPDAGWRGTADADLPGKADADWRMPAAGWPDPAPAPAHWAHPPLPSQDSFGPPAQRQPRLVDERPRPADQRPRPADQRPRPADQRPRPADRRPCLADERAGPADWPIPIPAEEAAHRPAADPLASGQPGLPPAADDYGRRNGPAQRGHYGTVSGSHEQPADNAMTAARDDRPPAYRDDENTDAHFGAAGADFGTASAYAGAADMHTRGSRAMQFPSASGAADFPAAPVGYQESGRQQGLASPAVDDDSYPTADRGDLHVTGPRSY